MQEATAQSAFTMSDMLKLGRKGLSALRQGGKSLVSGIQDTAHAAKMAG
jgi:hypothetical protein